MKLDQYNQVLTMLGKLQEDITAIRIDGAVTRKMATETNGTVKRHNEQIGILSTSVAHLEGKDEALDERKGWKLMSVQNIITAAALLIAIVTWIYK